MLVNNCLEGIAIEHGKHLALVSHLHGRRIVITVAGDYILAGTHGGNHKFLTQLAEPNNRIFFISN